MGPLSRFVWELLRNVEAACWHNQWHREQEVLSQSLSGSDWPYGTMEAEGHWCNDPRCPSAAAHEWDKNKSTHASLGFKLGCISHFSGCSFSCTHTILAALTQRAAALGPWAHALVLQEVKPQPIVPYRAGYVTQVVHQVSTQRTVQQGISQRGRRAKDVSCHDGDKADPGRNEPSLARLW